jgi:OHCU decarboxylase
MVAARPFSSIQDLKDAADLIWNGCSHEDWLEAFAAHPRIGERGKTEWSRQEQSGAVRVPQKVQDALIQANREYEAKYGYTFIICASGKSAEEMLAVLRQRLGNNPLIEIHNAAEQQRLITHLRLDRLLNEIHNNPCY